MIDNALTTQADGNLRRTTPWGAWSATTCAAWAVTWATAGLPGPLRAWLLLAAVVVGLKFVVLAGAIVSERERTSPARLAGFLLFWPGMMLRPFLAVGGSLPTPRRWWIAGLTNTVCGLTLLGIACRWPALRPYELARAAMGLAGIGLTVLFGLLQLLAAMWRSYGVRVERQWHWLWGMRGLSNYWNVRWNRAFHDFAREQVYGPLRRHLPAHAALLGTFLFSGVAHEILLSVPARGGYGGPTLYSVLQGFGILVERRCLPAGILRRLWAWFVLLAPLGLLFHQPFIHQVVLPQLDAWAGH